MLRQRLLVGSLLIVGVIAAFWADTRVAGLPLPQALAAWLAPRTTAPPGLVLLALIAVIVPLAAAEVGAVLRARGLAAPTPLLAAAAFATALCLYLAPLLASALSAVAALASVGVIALLAAMAGHARHGRAEGAAAIGAATTFAAAYLGLMGGFYLLMRHQHSAWVILAVILVTKMGDTGAYFTGRAIGRRKLIAWLSPKKTWEGLGGGIALAAAVAAALAWVSQETDLATVQRLVGGEVHTQVQRFDPAWSALGGAALAVVGHLGDLLMSLLKRDAGLKDSGSHVPGFGGVMDVIDSPLLAAPFAWWLLQAAGG